MANSIWLGLDNVLSLVGSAVTSILVARTFGPALLGHYAFVMMLVVLTGLLAGGSGMALVTRKLLAESLQRGRLAQTRLLFVRLLRFQTSIALTAVAIGMAASLLLVSPVFDRRAPRSRVHPS